MTYYLLLLFVFLCGLFLGYFIALLPESKPKKRIVGFAAHPEWRNTAGRPVGSKNKKKKRRRKVVYKENINKGDMLSLDHKPPTEVELDDDDVGVVKYKNLKEQEEDKDISKKEEEAAMSESLSKHFPIKN